MTNSEGEKQCAEKSGAALREEKILAFWKENDIFQKTLDKKAPKGEFVFYEGPPTANGKPGIHHLEARAFKDVIPRYKTMQGFHVRRKGGWDTHGLPVELQVEKELGLTSKKDIERYGIAAFNAKCKASVWEYRQEWEKFTERIGFWVDQKHPYVTYEPHYIESVWNLLRVAHEKGLLYKDYKVVPWCPRCGTALSSHELAQGYQSVKEISLYVKFRVQSPEKNGLPEDTYLLAWTTTPWTLPGNVALAVGNAIEYELVAVGSEHLIIAKNLREKVAPEGKSARVLLGGELLNLSYEPLYPYLKNAVSASEERKLHNAYRIYPADFVGAEDGTGIVHTAVMYGADDFELGTRVGLPKCHLVSDAGVFISETEFLAGKNVRDAAVDIIKDLHERGLLFKKEKIEHAYPHCWRCKTPLIYFARDSWYIRMSALREELIKENADIHWEPAHIHDGRFGEWLRDVKDWAISRERYWGTPLPFWIEKETGALLVIDSIASLKKHTKRSGNTYTIMRHGEAENNARDILSTHKENAHHLTERGKAQVQAALEKLKSRNIGKIIVSPFVRTQETARIIVEALALSHEDIVTEERLSEYSAGDFDGQKTSAVGSFWESAAERFEKKCPNGETLADVKRRMGDVLYELERTYAHENILIISHSTPLSMLAAAARGLTRQETLAAQNGRTEDFLPTAGFEEIDFTPLPHNEEYELDLHRPYIDEHIVLGENGAVLERVSEVLDVWFDSGAMPFAQDHYPMENKAWVDGKGYPADYIAEAIDQTRGWFYTLHAIGVLTGRGKAYRNVICLGHILDAEGKKMSKSVGNVVDPWAMIETYGADALRFWIYSVNRPGESKNFDEKMVVDGGRKTLNLLRNTLEFYTLYADKSVEASDQSADFLDVWMCARIRAAARVVMSSVEGLDILEAAREIRDCIGDFSQWYIRRSRDRFKSDDEKKRRAASATARFTLLTLSKIIAPFTPFVAEEVYGTVRMADDPESVHLSAWPVFNHDEDDAHRLEGTEEIRRLVSLGLEERAMAGIKVRQPLASLSVKLPPGRATWSEEAQALVRDELNVKRIIFDANMVQEVLLDTSLSRELRNEGVARELTRMIQELRKARKLAQEQEITLLYTTSEEGEESIREFKSMIQKTALIKTFTRVSDDTLEQTTIEGMPFSVRII